MIGVIFSSANIEISNLTTWSAFFNALLSILSNPFKLLMTFTALIGVYVNPTTKGLKD